MNRREFVEGVGAAVSLMAASPVWAQTHAPVKTVMGVRVWSPLRFGARGDGRTDDTHALQRTMDACAAAGGGVVVLPAGRTFVSGTLVLRSHVELHLAGGSVLRASANRDKFRALGSLLFAKDATDIHVSGTGTIDGNFAAFFLPKGPEGYAVPQPFLGPYDPLYGPEMRNPADGRPRMILLVNCKGVVLERFTIRDSPTWTIHPVGCEGVLISGISILNNLEVPNCDGIDVDHCREVRVEGCNIVAGDDCLVLKASRNFGEYGPCEGVTISNCTLESSSAGIKIETEGPFPLRSAVINNCTIARSNRGISFLNRDGATVEDLIFSDMTIETVMRTMMWWGSGEPVAMSSVPRVKGGPAGMVRGIQFVNMECRGESGIYLRGSAGAPLKDVSFRGVGVTVAKTTKIEGGFYDMRPGDAFGAAGLDRRATAGFFAAEVDGLQMEGVQVRWDGVAPAYFGAAVELHDCDEVSMVDVTGSAAHAGDAAIVMEDVTMAKMLRPSVGTEEDR
ncbi:MAG: glycosyl hydrolase family 28 protein [Acidobacteriaceae bacterium]